MGTFRVVVTDDRFGSYDEERAVLAEIGCSLEVCNLQDDDDAHNRLKGADALLINMFPMGSDLIARLDRCRVLSRYGVGVDNVDVEAATARGIWVARVPDYGFEEVSDHALALLLSLARNLLYVDKRIRQGDWNLKNEYRNHRMCGRVLGIVGFGLIGRALNRKVQSLGLSEVLVDDPYVDPKIIEAQGARSVDLDTLARESDYVSIHVPLTKETEGLFGDRLLGIMKPGALLVNTSRGGVVEERALVAALEAGTLSGAGLDVYEQEPLPLDSRLREMERVILTDHTAYYSEESIFDLKTKAARNVAEVLQGREPLYPVNRPASTS